MTQKSGSIGCVCITGGTGSFGSAFARFLLSLPTPPRIRIYSRDEHKQEDLARALHDDRVTFILGDIRDGDRLRRALDGCDALVHAAALKVVSQGEQHVTEFIGVNIQGSEETALAAIEAGVSRSVLISSDKAVQPINHYGACKMIAERVFIYANRLSVSRGLRFSVVRGGNVWGSRGSVVEVWREQRAALKSIQVYNPDTTRFHLPMTDWCAFVWQALQEQHGGEIFAPKLRAWRLGDLAEAFGGAVESGDNRNGDKQDEMLIAPHEVKRTVDIGWAYAIEPPKDLRDVWNYQPYHVPVSYAKIFAGNRYGSDTVARLSVAELKELIK